MPFLLKGTKVAVSGELSLREYVSKDGMAKSTLDVRVGTITLLSNKPASSDLSSQNVSTKMQQNEIDDEPPF